MEQTTILEMTEPRILVQGKPFETLPNDLYIPPEALKIFLEETFEGPLDLLLYLIRRQNLDILNIPIAEITRQYMRYIELMEEMNFELAADYLVMAAMLAEIKSRLLLPKPEIAEDEEDPRAELVRRLLEYERFKEAAENLDTLPIRGRDTFAAAAKPPEIKMETPPPTVELKELLVAFGEVMARAQLRNAHHVKLEPLSVQDRIAIILETLQSQGFVKFTAFFKIHEGRKGLVVTFIAILELLRASAIEIVQSEPFAPIYIKAMVI